MPIPPTQPNKPKNPNIKKTLLDPAQRDANRLKRHYPVKMMMHLLLVLLIFLLLACVILVYMIGTDGGTAYLIDKVSDETGITINYGDGNLRDGLWVTDLKIPAGDNVLVSVDSAKVKIGWRAIFDKEFHLRDVDVGNIRIIDGNVPSNDNSPFAFPDIAMPINFSLDHTKIDKIVYEKGILDPLIFSKIETDDLEWAGTKLTVDDVNLTYSYHSNSQQMDIDIVTVKGLDAKVDFTGDYSIKAKTTATLHHITEHYFDDIEINATGSLKNLHAKIKTKYNDAKLTGEVDVQIFAKDVPFTAIVEGKKVAVPYATDFDILLKKPIIKIDGNWRQMSLDIETDISAKHVPTGHYHGKADFTTLDGEFNVTELIAKTKKGTLHGAGELNWKNAYWMDVQVRSSDYQLDTILPKEWKEYQGYLPEYLDGSIDVKHQNSNAQGKMQIDTSLYQKNAETVHATLTQLQDFSHSKNPKKPNPYKITANWTKLKRTIKPELDVHKLEVIDSDEGTAELFIQGNRLDVTAEAQLNKLSIAPQGQYEIALDRVGNKMAIKALDYQGEVGNLTGTGSVTIPDGDEPIVWSLIGHTTELKPIVYNKSIPIELVTGEFSITDVMSFEMLTSDKSTDHEGEKQEIQRHKLTINRAKTQIVLDSQNPNPNPNQNSIGLDGSGNVELILDDVGLASFNADYTGALEKTELPKGQYAILAQGTPTDITIDKLHYQGDSGKLEGQAKIGFVSYKQTDNDKKAVSDSNIPDAKKVTGEDTNWQLTADVADFDVGFFDQEIVGKITGALETTGTLFTPLVVASNPNSIEDEVKRFSLTFDGDVSSKQAKSKKAKSEKAKFKAIEYPKNAENSLKSTAETDSQNQSEPIIIPSGKWKIDAKGNLDTITVKHIYHEGEAGLVDGKGVVNFDNGYQWNMTAKMKDFNIGLFAPDIASTLTGDVDTHGNWNDKSNKLRDFAVKFDGDVKADKLSSGKLTLDVSNGNTVNDTDKNSNKDKDLITINTFRHEGEAGFLNVTGEVKLSDTYSWQLQTQMKDFNFGYFMTDFPSTISGEFDTIGNWSDTSQQIDINKMDISGDIKDKFFNAKGQLSTKLKLPKDLTAFAENLQNSEVEQQYQQANSLVDKLEINDFVAKWGDNYLTADGDVNSLQAQVNISNLDQLHPDLKGELTGSVSLKDNAKDTNNISKENVTTTANNKQNTLPTLYVDLMAKKITLPESIGVAVTEGKIQGKVVNMGKGDSILNISAKELTSGSQTFKDLTAVFVGNQDKHKLKLSLANENGTVSGVLTGSLVNNKTGSGKTSNQWNGVLANSKISSEVGSDNVQLVQMQPSEMNVNLDDSEIALAAHCWQVESSNEKNKEKTKEKRDSTNNGKLCLKDNLLLSQNKGNINLTVQEVDTSLMSFVFPDELDWNAEINGKVNIDWLKGNKPNINAVIYSDNGKVGMEQDDESQSYFNYSRISLIALTTDEGLKLRTDIQSENKGKGYADITIDPYKVGKPISGEVSLHNINMVLFKPFFPGMSTLEGYTSLDASIDGTLKKPQIDGQFKLTDGRIAMLGLPVNLSKINLTATVNSTHANIDGIFYSGEGKGELTGTIDWQEKIQAKIGVTGTQLDLSQPPLLSAKVSPDINIIIKPQENYVQIKGAVSIPSATFRPPEVNEDIISKSADINVLDRRQAGNVDDVFAITQPWSINADIGIDLGNEVSFRGFGAELPMAGALVLRQRGQGKMTGRGVVQASRRTNIDAFGQTVGLDYAQIRFNGDIESPYLSIEASKTIEDSKVGFKIKGNISNPDITVFNDAGLTEQQAMNALVTGRLSNVSANHVSEEGFRSEVTNNLAAAGLSVGLDTTRNLTNQLGRAFGLQSLTLSASGNSDDTNVNVTGYITPDLYIRYGFGVFNAQSSLSARYQLTRRLYIEATSSTDKFVDLVYNWKF